MSNYDELGVKVQRAQAALAQVRGTAQFGGVSIEVDADKQLTNLHLTDTALDNGPSHLAELITKTYHEAITNAEPQLRAATAGLTDDPSVTRMVETLGTTLPPTSPSTMPTPNRSSDDELSWMQQQGSIMRRADARPHRRL